MRITVMEPFHSVFYAPHYVALHLGHFTAEGLEITTRTGAGSTSTTRALIEASAQISLGGLMRSLDLADRGGRLLPHFAEVNSRNGFFLIGRQPRARLAWPDIVGRTVISFTAAPTPYQSMLTVVRREGVDPARVTFVRDVAPPEAVAAFRGGRGDFIEVGQPTAELLLDEGFHLAVSMGDATGPVPFSSYMTMPDRLRHEPDLIVAFTRALYRTQRWIATHDAKAVAQAIAPSFADIPSPICERAVGRYLAQGTWARDPLLRRPGYEYLVDILLDGGFIHRRQRYQDLVDTALAERAMKTLKEG
jgi:NitT/TauT family transport system substrate-binding protein